MLRRMSNPPEPGAPWPPAGRALCDASVQLRQLLRDCGPTWDTARQTAKLLARTLSRPQPGGRVEGVRRRATHDWSMAIPFGFQPEQTSSPLRVAAICHVFHPDMAAELRDQIARIPGPLDVAVSTDTAEKCVQITQAFQRWDKGAVDVRIVENRGRDISPKVVTFADLASRYDVVLYLHSKRSSHFVDGPGWCRYLLNTLVGSSAAAISILEAFRRDPRLGLVMAQHWEPLRDRLDWGDNYFIARDLARRMNIDLTPGHMLDFPSGSMFWARPAALRPLFALGWTPEHFPAEMGQHDGTPAHAIERLFLFICEAAGYRWAKVCDPSSVVSKDAVIPIASHVALDRFRKRHSFRLTALGPS